MNIRAIQESDWEGLSDLAEHFYAEGNIPGTFDRESFIPIWRNFINQGFANVLIAEDHEAVVGTIGGFFLTDPMSGDFVCNEAWWFVHPEFRTVGVRLLRRWITLAKEAGCARLTMVHLCDSASERIGALYQRLGMKPLEHHYWMKL